MEQTQEKDLANIQKFYNALGGVETLQIDTELKIEIDKLEFLARGTEKEVFTDLENPETVVAYQHSANYFDKYSGNLNRRCSWANLPKAEKIKFKAFYSLAAVLHILFPKKFPEVKEFLHNTEFATIASQKITGSSLDTNMNRDITLNKLLNSMVVWFFQIKLKLLGIGVDSVNGKNFIKTPTGEIFYIDTIYTVAHIGYIYTVFYLYIKIISGLSKSKKQEAFAKLNEFYIFTKVAEKKEKEAINSK
jgi:hypothetical protein